jgi:hypothetical protein
MALTTEIGLVKTEIASSLAASLFNAKDLVYVSKAIEALANAESSGGSFAIAYIDDIIYVGPAAAAFEAAAALTNPVAVFQIAANDFAQVAFKNTSSNANASTDFIAYTNNGSDSDGYIDMGITSSNFADPDFTITGKGDGYIFMVGAAGGTDKGNLVLATGDTGAENKIIFAAGGLASDNAQMSITPDVNVHIEIPTPSTSPTTGALTVVGGVGISGDVNINGSITFGGESSSLETTTLAVADPLIFVGSNNRTDAVDLGLIAEYATSTTTITKAISNKALTSNVATLTTSTTHGFAVGDIVVVGSVDATFNGTHVVKAVPTTTTFTYDKTNANVTSAAVSPAGTAEVTTKRRFAGAIRDASDGVFKIFKDATTKPSTTVNLAEAGASLGSLLVGAAEIGDVSNTEIQYLNGVTSAIQTQINNIIPTQTSNSGKYLTTDGSAVSWATVDALPSQTGNSGNYLTTNGTAATWAAITTDPNPQIFMLMGA